MNGIYFENEYRDIMKSFIILDADMKLLSLKNSFFEADDESNKKLEEDKNNIFTRIKTFIQNLIKSIVDFFKGKKMTAKVKNSESTTVKKYGKRMEDLDNELSTFANKNGLGDIFKSKPFKIAAVAVGSVVTIGTGALVANNIKNRMSETESAIKKYEKENPTSNPVVRGLFSIAKKFSDFHDSFKTDLDREISLLSKQKAELEMERNKVGKDYKATMKSASDNMNKSGIIGGIAGKYRASNQIKDAESMKPRMDELDTKIAIADRDIKDLKEKKKANKGKK